MGVIGVLGAREASLFVHAQRTSRFRVRVRPLRTTTEKTRCLSLRHTGFRATGRAGDTGVLVLVTQQTVGSARAGAGRETLQHRTDIVAPCDSRLGSPLVVMRQDWERDQCVMVVVRPAYLSLFSTTTTTTTATGRTVLELAAQRKRKREKTNIIKMQEVDTNSNNFTPFNTLQSVQHRLCMCACGRRPVA